MFTWSVSQSVSLLVSSESVVSQSVNSQSVSESVSQLASHSVRQTVSAIIIASFIIIVGMTVQIFQYKLCH